MGGEYENQTYLFLTMPQYGFFPTNWPQINLPGILTWLLPSPPGDCILVCSCYPAHLRSVWYFSPSDWFTNRLPGVAFLLPSPHVCCQLLCSCCPFHMLTVSCYLLAALLPCWVADVALLSHSTIVNLIPKCPVLLLILLPNFNTVSLMGFWIF